MVAGQYLLGDVSKVTIIQEQNLQITTYDQINYLGLGGRWNDGHLAGALDTRCKDEKTPLEICQEIFDIFWE